jgi:hypothetical protein
MPHRLVHKTWTIRTISPFKEAWNLEDLRSEELLTTPFVRNFVGTHGKVERDGTYVTIEWIRMNDGSGNEHLHIAVHVTDSPAAQLVLCYATRKPDEDNDELVSSFAYALVHGDRKCYEILLSYLEKEVGCVVSSESFRPSSADITRILMDTVHVPDEGECEGQLELTFGTPRCVTKLSSMTISVPPTSLARLLLELENTRPSNQDGASALGNALRAFILDAFCIDVRALPLIRVGNNVLIIGANGRIKLTKKDTLGVLGTISTMIRERMKPGKTSKKRHVSKKRKITQACEEESPGGEFEGGESSENASEEDEGDDDEGGDDERKPRSVADEADREQEPSEKNGSTVPIGRHLDGELEEKEMIAI